MEGSASLPLFVCLLDPSLAANPEYLAGVIDGFYNLVDAQQLNRTYYREGAIEGMRLWEDVFCASEVDHDSSYVEHFLTEANLKATVEVVPLESLGASDLEASPRAVWPFDWRFFGLPILDPDAEIHHVALC